MKVIITKDTIPWSLPTTPLPLIATAASTTAKKKKKERTNKINTKP